MALVSLGRWALFQQARASKSSLAAPADGQEPHSSLKETGTAWLHSDPPHGLLKQPRGPREEERGRELCQAPQGEGATGHLYSINPGRRAQGDGAVQGQWTGVMGHKHKDKVCPGATEQEGSW